MNTIKDKENLYKVMRSKADLSQLSKVAKALEDDPNLLQTFNQAEQLSGLLKEYNITSLDALKSLEFDSLKPQKGILKIKTPEFTGFLCLI